MIVKDGEDTYAIVFDDKLVEPTPLKAAPVAAEAAPPPAAPQAAQRAFIADVDAIAPPQPPIALAEDDFFFERGFQAIDAMEQSTLDQAAKPPLLWSDLPGEAQGAINNYITHVKDQMSTAKYAATRFAEFRRDAALLNYTRRMNYNTWLGIMAPFEFWTTNSMIKWALHSIDRPQMLMAYLRFKKMLEQSGVSNQALPSRLRGTIRIPLPFLPDWMGDALFVDPLRLILPMDTFAYPYEQWQQNQQSAEGRASRVIGDWEAEGKITGQEAAQAMQTQSGRIWEDALSKVYADDPDVKNTAWDFVNMMTPFHAPIVWAKEYLSGTPENIAPFTPMSRTIKGVAGLLGVDWDNSPMNLEARIRQHLGLQKFDKWDEYRVKRMLSNMTARGEITTDQALRAGVEKQGDIWQVAVEKANKEFGIMAGIGALGIPAKIYPEGEWLQRNLKDDFDRAYTAYADGETQALTNFFNLHPEYETRLGLFKSPEERLQLFVVDELWNKWNELPKLHKSELQDQLGDEFTELFLNKETQAFDAIPIQTMQVWLKLMGGDPPGTLNSPVPSIELAPADLAWRADTFYKTRNAYYPDYYDLQDAFFKLTEKGKARETYKKEHPELELYWDWRRDWFHRNPDVVPYLDDNFQFEYKSAAQYEQVQERQPFYSWDEWRQTLGPNVSNLVMDYVLNDDNLPSFAIDRLENAAEGLGIDYDEMLRLMRLSIEEQ